eukprot:1015243-Amphidinium_carterae.1
MAITTVAKSSSDLKRTATAHTEDVQGSVNSSQVMSPNGTIVGGLTGNLQPIPINTPRTRKKIMGEQTDPQTAQLANTMVEFSSSMNDCISQPTLELERVQSSTGMTVTPSCKQRC